MLHCMHTSAKRDSLPQANTATCSSSNNHRQPACPHLHGRRLVGQATISSAAATADGAAACTAAVVEGERQRRLLQLQPVRPATHQQLQPTAAAAAAAAEAQRLQDR
jgi:hypothetical protein